ncbi:MAG TPA: phytoene/squalene synthase family protein [Pyrinomonadaceae bacterium]|nr:phytoene/squalene synthase family protein [Pyrinomonadaceae bacterium]
MLANNRTNRGGVWSAQDWEAVERLMRVRALRAVSERAAWKIVCGEARRVMRTYSTSFFIVSRFLPAAKREEVEVIYAAVRYPDEIVDTFPLERAERVRLLDEWGEGYEEGLASASIGDALQRGVPCFLASFTRVVRERGIPPEHYRAFLAAMRRDAEPRPFETLADLIENYIYGSAVVVGYFLAYVYGASDRENFPRALESARALGIALQLTNFLRDVGEDKARGRVYLPQDMLRAEGIVSAATDGELDLSDAREREALARVLCELARVAESFYAAAERDLDAFAPDCQIAIRACIGVYRRLNERIGLSPDGILHRASVPASEKFGVLPPSKYWRIPLAYLRR